VPYIKFENRVKYDKALNDLSNIETKGDLEYCVFRLMQNYRLIHGEKYAQLHDCVYAVQHCSDEFRRRFLDIREDQARKENGDINV